MRLPGGLESDAAGGPLPGVSWFLTTTRLTEAQGRQDVAGTGASTLDDWDGTAVLGGVETPWLLQI